MEMTFLILYCRLNGQGNQKGLIWDNLLPLSKMSYQEKSPCKSPFCMVVAQQVSRKILIILILPEVFLSFHL